MDVFSLRNKVVGSYRDFTQSFGRILDPEIKNRLHHLYDQGKFWPQPLVQISPAFQRGAETIKSLADKQFLHPSFAQSKHRLLHPEHHLYQHQEHALTALGIDPESTSRPDMVVTTGTGSGKSLCYLLPAISSALTAKDRGDKRIVALLVYPTNALVQSQIHEVRSILEALPNQGKSIRAEALTGDSDLAARAELADQPPSLLLTNYVMLERLLLQGGGQSLARSLLSSSGRALPRIGDQMRDLEFLVLDEMHTYRGGLGADMAMLVRRLRVRQNTRRLTVIGASATMSSGTNRAEARQAVARVARCLFATPANRGPEVIEEALAQITDRSALGEPRDEKVYRAVLARAIAEPVPQSMPIEALKQHPLAIWIEETLGLEKGDLGDPSLRRARPRTVSVAAQALAEASGASAEAAEIALKGWLLLCQTPGGPAPAGLTAPDRQPSPSLMAFRLHQFVSGARQVLVTLEPWGKRTITFSDGRYASGDRDSVLFEAHFCPKCGQDYQPVYRDGGTRGGFSRRSIDDAGDDESRDGSDPSGPESINYGFVCVQKIPESGRTASIFIDSDKLGSSRHVAQKKTSRSKAARAESESKRWAAQACQVDGRGQLDPYGTPIWFLPGRFRQCIRCGEEFNSRGKDRFKLAPISPEGRSSALQVMATSALLWMHKNPDALPRHSRKLIAFADNRQDVALQAAYTEDALRATLLRAGLLAALDAEPDLGLAPEEWGAKLLEVSGLSRPEGSQVWGDGRPLSEEETRKAHNILRLALTLGVYRDLRPYFLATHKNLVQLGAAELRVKYADRLDDESIYSSSDSILQQASSQQRKSIFSLLFSSMAEKLAIEDDLWAECQKIRSLNLVQERWLNLRLEDNPFSSLRLKGKKERNGGAGQSMIASLTSTLGRRLMKEIGLWPHAAEWVPNRQNFESFMLSLLQAATQSGMLIRHRDSRDFCDSWRLAASKLHLYRTKPGPERPKHYHLDLYNALGEELRSHSRKGTLHPWAFFEAASHSAQTTRFHRDLREKRFRFDPEEVARLEPKDRRLLPMIFCSPTMELGVDISALNVVMMRNVPPTPANYAQRSGRAGRAGWSALVVTYCSAYSPHDQQAFLDPESVVRGVVSLPIIDLTNQKIVESHLHAEWMSATQMGLSGRVPRFIDRTAGGGLQIASGQGLEEPEAQAMETAVERMRQVLVEIENWVDPRALSGGWFKGAREEAARVAQHAWSRLDASFERFRHDLRTTRDARARAQSLESSVVPEVQRNAFASMQESQAHLKNLESAESQGLDDELEIYRYLAFEGFLPGYEFPKLPIPALLTRQHQAAFRKSGDGVRLVRPRFLALTEFAPESLIYHESDAYRVSRMFPGEESGSGHAPGANAGWLAICSHCGAAQRDEHLGICQFCHNVIPDDSGEIYRNLVAMGRVSAVHHEHVDASAEERQRRGFETRLTFESYAMSAAAHRPRFQSLYDGKAEALCELEYIPSASLYRLNRGRRRRGKSDEVGFDWSVETGQFLSGKGKWSVRKSQTAPSETRRERIVPMVRDIKNVFWMGSFSLEQGWLCQTTVVTLKHALVRGICAEAGLDDREIAVEAVPFSSKGGRALLFYEVSEGGAGVLQRLVADPEALSRVARRALDIMHYTMEDPATNGEQTNELPRLRDKDGASDCIAACYTCLLSYFNQVDHQSIERKDRMALEVLRHLAVGQTVRRASQLHASTREWVSLPEKMRTEAVLWCERAKNAGLPLAEEGAREHCGQGAGIRWGRLRVVACLKVGQAHIRELENRGYKCVCFAGPETWQNAFVELAKLLTASAGGEP